VLLAGLLLKDYLTKTNLTHQGYLFDFNKGSMFPIKANTQSLVEACASTV